MFEADVTFSEFNEILCNTNVTVGLKLAELRSVGALPPKRTIPNKLPPLTSVIQYTEE